MTTNSLIISKIYEELKYLFDYNLDYRNLVLIVIGLFFLVGSNNK